MRKRLLLLGVMMGGCVDAATSFAECEAVVAVVEAKCPECTGMNEGDSGCEGWAYFMVTGGSDSCVGRRVPAGLEDYWSTCVHPTFDAICDLQASELGRLMPEECSLEYDFELAEAQEEAGIGS